MRRESLASRASRLLRWLWAATIDVACCAVLVLALVECCWGQSCYTDPYTGQTICTTAPRPSTLDPPRASQLAPPPAAQVLTTDREVPTTQPVYDFASGTLIYDDGVRAIALTCGHNLRNTAPPYWIRLGTGPWRAARILALDLENELGALEFAGGTGVAPAIVADGPPPNELTGCGFGGASDGYRYTCVSGALSNVPFAQAGFRSFTGQVRQGDSGGPVWGPDGRLVGVLWGNHTEYGQVMFTCDQPLRRFLDRILPNRPGRLIPHAEARGPSGEALVPNSPLPTPNSPLPLPPRIVPAPPARQPASEEAQGASGEARVPNSPLPTPHSPFPLPPSPLPTPTLPPLGPTHSGPSDGGPAPPWPSVYERSNWLDRLGRAGLTQALTFLGLSATGAGVVALPAWLLVKWGARREAARIRARLQNQGGSAPAAVPAEQNFQFQRRSAASQPVERSDDEALQLLRLHRLEGRDPLQDATIGRVIRSELEAVAESRNSDPNHRQWAANLIHEANKRFNTIAPTKFSPPTGE